MPHHNLVTITGDLGSGKSTVANLLAERRHARRYSAGAAQRHLAEAKGLTTLQLNKLAEVDPSIDSAIDGIFESFVACKEELVIDARLAWYFIPNSLKIRLVVNPEIAAKRILSDKKRVSESFDSESEAFVKIQARRESEARHFYTSYGIKIEKDDPFDLVINTQDVHPEQVVDLIEKWDRGLMGATKYWITPKALYPSQDIRPLARMDAVMLAKDIKDRGYDMRFPISVVRKDGYNYIWDGHRRTSGAIFANIPFIPFRLAKGEVIVNLSQIYDWEATHNDFRFPVYPKPQNGSASEKAYAL